MILISCFFIFSSLFLFHPLISLGNTHFFKLILICAPLCILGFWDDYKNINQKIRYLIQLLTAIFLLINSKLSNIDFSLTGVLILLFFLILITGLINFINFMDGIDGLVIGSFVVIFSALTIKFNVNFIVITSILVLFLKWNWNPAQLFIGDAGSTFIGAIYAGAIFSSYNYLESLSILLMSMPLIMDATFCLGWRFCNGFNIFDAHNMHLYQRLVKAGFSHENVSYMYIFSIGLISLFYLIGNIFMEVLALGLILLFGIYLNFQFAMPLSKSKS